MGSKAPSPSTRPPGDRLDNKPQDLIMPGRSATSLRVRRVADALQVDQSVLYNPPSAVAPTRETDGDRSSGAGLDQECEALLHAYRRIRDPEERQRLLVLVQEAAEQI
jgi:hypothetical protein